MKAREIAARISAFNRELDPDTLKLKYEAMRADAFAFFRGTCHLFYEDLPADAKLNDAPAVWNCGDLHLQNFGSFKAAIGSITSTSMISMKRLWLRVPGMSPGC